MIDSRRQPSLWPPLAILCALGVSLAGATEGNWIRVRSRHFELLTNAGAGAGRAALGDFHKIDWVFRQLFGESKVEPRPLRIYLFRSRRDFLPYALSPSETAAGYYLQREDRDFIVIRDLEPAEARRAVYHEYAHLKVHEAGFDLPMWLDEGFAEFFSTAALERTSVRLGDPIPQHIEHLRRARLLDLETLMQLERDSPELDRDQMRRTLYAQSWALAHMLLLDREYRQSLGRFLELASAGPTPEEWFRPAYNKSPGQVHRDLVAYLTRRALPRTVIANLKEAPALQVYEERPSGFEAAAALASLHIQNGRPDLGVKLLQEHAGKTPDHSAIEEALGYAALAEDAYASAARHLDRAIALGTTSALVWFERAGLLRRSGAGPDAVRAALQRAVGLNSGFAAAHEMLGNLELEAGNNAAAESSLRRAAELEPWKAHRWQALVHACVQQRKFEAAREAAEQCRRAASSSAERAMAEATLQLAASGQAFAPAVMAREREPLVPDTWKNPPGNRRLAGLLLRVDCLKETARLVVQAGSGTVMLLVRDPGRVVLRNSAGGVTEEFRCGPQPRRPVTVEYVEKHDAASKTAGEVTQIEFLAPK